jgi:hypothetical protein
MRPVSVFANGPEASIEHLRGRWAAGHSGNDGLAVGARTVPSPDRRTAGMRCKHGAALDRPVQHTQGPAGLANRPRPGRPRIGGPRLLARIAALLEPAGLWTVPRVWQYLGRPKLSTRTLYRRLGIVAIWRRPKLVARGDPDRWRAASAITARLRELPRGALVWATDETHGNLLPHMRATWTLRPRRPKIGTPGKNQQVTVFGAPETTSGQWVYRLGRRCAADFIALLEQIRLAVPAAPRSWAR